MNVNLVARSFMAHRV